ncbi:hypothetical protein CLI64_00080 [Nostoc sp. CENA543]|nr:hypothetical protein CLI64_00080 [Nostoc sp. CENA543]
MPEFTIFNPAGEQSPVQTKLAIGEPGDKYEQEADRTAKLVVQRINAPAIARSTSEPSIQQQGGLEVGEATPDLESTITSARSGGQSESVTIQRQAELDNPNHTGLPTYLKTGVENLSGYSLNDVKVHYNSPKPARLQALAYTQGTDIHLAPGQEKHLPHEAWHVVQQKQGRVEPTIQMKGLEINDDEGLEKEADVMGEKAASISRELQPNIKPVTISTSHTSDVVQGEFIQTGLFKWQDQDTGKEYEQSEARVDDTIKVSGYEEEFYIRYLNGKWERATTEFHEQEEPNFMDVEEVSQDSDESNDSDHGAENAHASTEDLYPDELEPSEFATIPDYEKILQEIFINMLEHYQINIHKEELWMNVFTKWKEGVHTRGWWENIKKQVETQNSTGNTEQPLQMKRTPNTLSYQEKYKTKNFGEFKKITYLRDGKGNINFSKPQKKKVWQDPIEKSTKVKLNKGMKNKKYGIMGGGQKVQIAGASRAQHFSMGDRLCTWAKNNRGGAWTWHHLSKEYEMVLVDMTVHAKHGHNGGVLLWK